MGPHLKTPAIAAGGVAMAGTAADASTSRTITEGLTEKAILFSFNITYLKLNLFCLLSLFYL